MKGFRSEIRLSFTTDLPVLIRISLGLEDRGSGVYSRGQLGCSGENVGITDISEGRNETLQFQLKQKASMGLETSLRSEHTLSKGFN